MKDFFKAALIYVPAYFVGRAIADHAGDFGFMLGWMFGGTAVILRMYLFPPPYSLHR